MGLKLYDTLSREVRDVFAMDENSFVFTLADLPFMDHSLETFELLSYRMFFGEFLRLGKSENSPYPEPTGVDDKTIRQSQGGRREA